MCDLFKVVIICTVKKTHIIDCNAPCSLEDLPLVMVCRCAVAEPVPERNTLRLASANTQGIRWDCHHDDGMKVININDGLWSVTSTADHCGCRGE